jgi:hypothetical protein
MKIAAGAILYHLSRLAAVFNRRYPVDMWKYVILYIGALFGVSFLEYCAGRILLPDMGLMPPGYWKWYWAMFIISLGVAAVSVIKEIWE